MTPSPNLSPSPETRRRRYDYACRFEVGDAAPTAQLASARRTPEGYLEVDGYLARSGLLEYSDGVESWTEYRSKDELRKAARSWNTTPITDEHPDDMVDASNWTQLARGHHLEITGVETLDDNEDYVRARLLITDREFVEKVDAADGPRELSIGFSAAVLATEDGFAADGTPADAVQIDLQGNHTAVVRTGRAGPSARLRVDGAAYLRPPVSPPMPHPKNAPPAPTRTAPRPRTDEIGAPVELVEIVGPDGQALQVPTWLAAIYEQSQTQAAEPMDAPVPATHAAPPSPSPGPSSAPPAPPAPGPAPLTQADLQRVRDEANAMGRRRARLERLAVSAGVPEATIDAADDLDELGRLYVRAKMPQAHVDALRGDALDAFVDTVRSLPAPASETSNPWEQPKPVGRGDAADLIDARTVQFMERNGY